MTIWYNFISVMMGNHLHTGFCKIEQWRHLFCLILNRRNLSFLNPGFDAAAIFRLNRSCIFSCTFYGLRHYQNHQYLVRSKPSLRGPLKSILNLEISEFLSKKKDFEYEYFLPQFRLNLEEGSDCAKSAREISVASNVLILSFSKRSNYISSIVQEISS